MNLEQMGGKLTHFVTRILAQRQKTPQKLYLLFGSRACWKEKLGFVLNKQMQMTSQKVECSFLQGM